MRKNKPNNERDYEQVRVYVDMINARIDNKDFISHYMVDRYNACLRKYRHLHTEVEFERVQKKK